MAIFLSDSSEGWSWSPWKRNQRKLRFEAWEPIFQPFLELVQKTCQVYFSYLLRHANLCKGHQTLRKFLQKCQKIAGCWEGTVYGSRPLIVSKYWMCCDEMCFSILSVSLALSLCVCLSLSLYRSLSLSLSFSLARARARALFLSLHPNHPLPPFPLPDYRHTVFIT